ncbi:MAG: serine hydrolase domain-containing protein [Acidobacteriota bacterium]
MLSHMRCVVSGIVVFALAGAAAAQGTGAIVNGEVANRVDQYLTRLVPYGFSGAVLVAKNGEVILKKGYGLADRDGNVPYRPDMVSCIGSVTKQFTGAAILKLEMQGKLKTSDPISTYLPGVPPDKAGITIQHLMTHTAGFSGDLGGMDEEPIARDALVAKVLAAPLASKPGEKFEYSNEGFSLAGAIVERVSGKGYEAYVRENLFLPAGMMDTGYLAPAWLLSRLPIGYRPDGKPWGRVYQNGWLPDGPGWYLRANGGIHSSLDDLYRWHLALASDKVLSPAALQKYQAGDVPSFGNERYGYGWGVQTTRRGTKLITHNGGNGFFFTDVLRFVDEKVVIIAMTNQPVIPATQVARRQLEALVFGDQPVVVPPVGIAVARDAREALAGRYALATGGLVTVRATPDGLEADADDPTLLGAIPGLTAPGGRFSAMETKTLALLDAAAKDDVRPIFEAFNDERPFDVVQGNQRRFWADWRSQFGEFKRLELLGTASVQGDPAVTVRLQFERGGPTVQFIWGPRRLAGFRILPAATGQPTVFVAESPTSWVSYSYRAPALLRLTFDRNGGVQIEGPKGKSEGKKQ